MTLTLFFGCQLSETISSPAQNAGFGKTQNMFSQEHPSHNLNPCIFQGKFNPCAPQFIRRDHPRPSTCFSVRALERFLCKYCLSHNHKSAFLQSYLGQTMLIADPTVYILSSSLILSSILILGSHLFRGSPSQAGQEWRWSEELVFIRLNNDVSIFPLTSNQCVLLDRLLVTLSLLFNSDLVQMLGSLCLWILSKRMQFEFIICHDKLNILLITSKCIPTA